jgi:hypothetical protein
MTCDSNMEVADMEKKSKSWNYKSGKFQQRFA